MLKLSPHDILTAKSPKLATAVEQLIAKSTMAGNPADLRGYSIPDKGINIVQLSVGSARNHQHFTMQFNPAGGVVISQARLGEAAREKPAVVLDFDRDRPRHEASGPGSMVEASMALTATAIDMATYNARFGLAMSAAMMGAGQSASASVSVDTNAEAGPADNVVQLHVVTSSPNGSKSRTKVKSRIETVEAEHLAKPSDAIDALQQWASVVVPGANPMARKPTASPAPAPAALKG